MNEKDIDSGDRDSFSTRNGDAMKIKMIIDDQAAQGHQSISFDKVKRKDGRL